MYDETETSALKVTPIAPTYDNEVKMEDGRLILRENYVKLLADYPQALVFGEDAGKIGGVNQTLINTNQDGSYAYVNVNKHEQKKALDFLDKELWDTPTWLLNKDIISQFNNSDGLYKIEAMHERALNSLLSNTRLNRMLSSDNSIKGDGLKYYELFDNLFESIFQKVSPTDQIKRNLQISFAKKIKVTARRLNPLILFKFTVFIKVVQKPHKRSTKLKIFSDQIRKASKLMTFDEFDISYGAANKGVQQDLKNAKDLDNIFSRS